MRVNTPREGNRNSSEIGSGSEEDTSKDGANGTRTESGVTSRPSRVLGRRVGISRTTRAQRRGGGTVHVCARAQARAAPEDAAAGARARTHSHTHTHIHIQLPIYTTAHVKRVSRRRRGMASPRPGGKRKITVGAWT